jgi:hypothetical protein
MDKDFNKNKPQQQQLLSSLHTLLDTDVRFSEGRCGKVLPLATATYQENLPPHYTRDYHESKVTNEVCIPSSIICLNFLLKLHGALLQRYLYCEVIMKVNTWRIKLFKEQGKTAQEGPLLRNTE